MAEWLIGFKHKVDGVPADVTSAVLRDEAGTFAVRRLDTMAVVVPLVDGAGVPLLHAGTGTGLYNYTVSDLVPGVTYQAYVEWVYNGETKRVERLRTIGTTAGSPYASLEDMTDAWTDARIAEISKTVPSAAGINTTKVQRALEVATVRFHDALGSSGYALPLTGLSAGDAVRVRDVVVRLAFGVLYEWRIGKDLDTEGRPVHPAKVTYASALVDAKNMAAGFVKLSATRRSRSPTGVAGIAPTRIRVYP